LAARVSSAACAAVALLALAPAAFAAASLRFHGNGSGGIDRVRIAVDDPANTNPGPPADVGAADVTVEFWMTAAAADNTAGAIACGANKAWKNGNVVLDRDRTGADRNFGVAIAGGKVVFGVSGDGTGDLTICGTSNVLDARWHHVAVERRRSDGWMWLFVDGVLEAEADGPDGDVSYPDDAPASSPDDPFLAVGAEKFDTGPAFDGSLDEIRLSSSLRYAGEFSRPRAPFATDASTAALYHLDEAAGAAAGDSSGASGGPSDGTLAVGGSPSGPQWSSAVAPLAGLPAVMLTPLPGSFSSPVQVTNAHDGSDRLFVVEQTGYIRIYENGTLLSTPFLDIHTLVTCCGEQGLLSVAFHPNYGSNGYFYVYYINNIASPGDITIARYSVSAGDANVADPNSAQILLVIPHPTNSNHNGGQLFFGPTDGYLYIGTGDGGAGGDPPNNAQNLQVLLGKILRIDVNGSSHVPCGQSSLMPYLIPPSNPFAGATPGCDEIWAYGMRNPWRYSFDRVTSDLLIGDVGQNLYEEIDFQPASSAGGENYGWRMMEGFHCYDPSTNCNDGSLTLPILEHSHGDGWCAIIGGYRYRGTGIPGLLGTYVYSDNCLGDLYGATQAGDGSWTTSLLKATSYSISGFGEDEAGELYACDLGGGKIYRIDPSPYPVPAASSLSPAAVIAGDPDFGLTVNGSGFVYGSVVRWNGADRPTALVSASKLLASIPASDILGAGTAAITVFTPAPGGGTSATLTLNINLTFLDVPTTHFAYQYIQAVYNAGVTAGCGTRLYCPDATTTRAQMAVFLLKAREGSSYTPPACTGTVFNDVPCTGGAFDPWIEDLYSRGITGGCQAAPPLYCPSATVTRAQMSAFLLKTEHGSSYVPPGCAGVFGDVLCPSLFADWIEQLATEGVTAGCGSGNYCPSSPVTRAQMAVFLTKTFTLPLP
jgi:glucose/arabinose dehydrogenase